MERGKGVYNRYIPQNGAYTPAEPEEREVPRPGKKFSELLKGLKLERLDSGDLLLLLIILLLWKEGEDTDLLIALGAALLLGREG